MNADQKKRIAHEISNWKNACNCRAVQLTGDRMAALLQELVDAPEPEPVAVIDNAAPGLINWYSWKATNLPDGTNLYTTPPAQSVPDGLHLLISGAVYDFAGFLTTREKTIQVGARVGADIVVDLLKEWAALRGLKLDDAAVLSWQEWLSPTPPEPPADVALDAEPVAYVTGVYGGHTTVAPIDAAQVLRVGVALYTAPPAPSVPPVRSTGQWESSRIADYNRGWNDCREATEKALNDLEKRK
jgi:hypothetical protein